MHYHQGNSRRGSEADFGPFRLRKKGGFLGRLILS
jgi:hypothetical protein